MAFPPPPAASKTFAIGDFVEITTDAPAEYRQRAGFITEAGPGRDEYRIEFEDGEIPTTGYLNATCVRRGPARTH